MKHIEFKLNLSCMEIRFSSIYKNEQLHKMEKVEGTAILRTTELGNHSLIM